MTAYTRHDDLITLHENDIDIYKMALEFAICTVTNSTIIITFEFHYNDVQFHITWIYTRRDIHIT